MLYALPCSPREHEPTSAQRVPRKCCPGVPKPCFICSPFDFLLGGLRPPFFGSGESRELPQMSASTDILALQRQKLDDDLGAAGIEVKHHEENMQFLKSKIYEIDQSCAELHVETEGSYHASSQCDESHTVEAIIKQEKTAAAIVCQVKARHELQAARLCMFKDVLGVVATLAKVENEELSRLLSEFLGLENMLAIVCKTNASVQLLEKYDTSGMIDKRSGLHGLGPTIGRYLDGKFRVFCLENIIPFPGEIKVDDPQMRLVLYKPRSINGKPPTGFIGFAVNMIHLDREHLMFVTASGHGLRETLFYSLFSKLQVYKTRADMNNALSYISDGAISLDGGILQMKRSAYYLGSRKNVEIKFPVCPVTLSEERVVKDQMKILNWRRELLLKDVEREEQLLQNASNSFVARKKDLLDFISNAQHELLEQYKFKVPSGGGQP